MKQLITLIILLSTYLPSNGQTSYLQYPNYDTVLSEFFNNYSVKSISSTSQIQFEKQPTGWFISIVDYADKQKKISTQLFWERENSIFKKLDFQKLGSRETNQEEITKFKNEKTLQRQFKISPYYGYSGWDRDVINDFENISKLSDTTLYALGRAYSSFASNLLNNNSGYADEKVKFTLPQGENSLTTKQLEKYRFYRHKAIEKFTQLYKRNPKFKTLVGTIQEKLSNEYVTSFLDLRIYQNEIEARKEIEKDIYSELYLSNAKNYLSSCAPNAILFTRGDNDTYPLLYVQSKFGFRKDVSVVNIGLLANDRYINSLRKSILDVPSLPISLTPNEISEDNRVVILIEKEIDKPMELSEIIAFIKDEEHIKTYDRDYFYIPTNKFFLKQGDNIIEWESNEPYFYKDILIMLDIIATNKWKRPIYFSDSIYENSHFGLSKHLQLEGLTYKLSTTKNNNTSVLYHNLMTKFNWSGIDLLLPQESPIYSKYRAVFHQLAEALISKGKKEMAEKVLDRCIMKIPDSLIKYNIDMIAIMEDYYKLNNFNKGNKIAVKLQKKLKNDIANDYKIERAKSILTYLKSLTKKYNQ